MFIKSLKSKPFQKHRKQSFRKLGAFKAQVKNLYANEKEN